MWLVTDARLMVIEQRIVATGGLSLPLAEDPPGVRRREGLPGDRLRLEAFFAGPEGPVDPVGPPIWIRSGFPYVTLRFAADIGPCGEDGLDLALQCRVLGDELTLPPVPIGGFQGRDENFVFMFASTSAEYDAEDCLNFYIRGGEGERFGCHFSRERLAYGPTYRVEELAGVEVSAPEAEPDYYAESLRAELTFSGPAGVRTQTAVSGEVVTMRGDERLALELVADEEELQTVTEERLEFLWASFFASAPLLPESAFYSGSSLASVQPPDDGGAFLYSRVGEDGRPYSRHESWQWFYLQLVLGDPEAPPP